MFSYLGARDDDRFAGNIALQAFFRWADKSGQSAAREKFFSKGDRVATGFPSAAW